MSLAKADTLGGIDSSGRMEGTAEKKLGRSWAGREGKRMSANDIYLIRETKAGTFSILHGDAEDEPNYREVVVGIRGLRKAIKRCEEERPAEYGYSIDLLEKGGEYA